MEVFIIITFLLTFMKSARQAFDMIFKNIGMVSNSDSKSIVIRKTAFFTWDLMEESLVTVVDGSLQP